MYIPIWYVILYNILCQRIVANTIYRECGRNEWHDASRKCACGHIFSLSEPLRMYEHRLAMPALVRVHE